MRFVLLTLLTFLPRFAAAAPSPGEPWGMCLEGLCVAGALCVNDGDANICAPICNTPACTAGVSVCGEEISATCLDTGLCVIECADDNDCLQGQVCESGKCAWPTPTPLGTWSPCANTCDGGFCVVSTAGSICLPPCGDGGSCKTPTDICGEDLPVECAQTGACILPCDGDGGCWGDPGLICDPDAAMCVVPH